MRRSAFVLFFSIVLFACQSNSNEYSNATEVNKAIKDVQWMIGNWQDSLRPGQWEVWTKNKYGMYGRGLAVQNMDTTQFEELSIVEDNGELVYIANVKGNDYPVKFVNTKLDSNAAQFENPNHDFPKLIYYQTYRSNKKQILHATVAGDNKRLDLYYIKR